MEDDYQPRDLPAPRRSATTRTKPASDGWRVAPAPRPAHERAERALRAEMEAGATGDAGPEVLRLYGDEVYGFLVAALDGMDAARDVYARFKARVAREVEGFAWRCSLRAWVYAIARGEVGRYHEGVAETRVAGSSSSVALPAPQNTLPCRHVAEKAAIAALRSRLAAEDRAILILRIDRGFGWGDLAITSLGEGASASDLVQEGDRLRLRLQHIREELARAAVEENLLAPR